MFASCVEEFGRLWFIPIDHVRREIASLFESPLHTSLAGRQQPTNIYGPFVSELRRLYMRIPTYICILSHPTVFLRLDFSGVYI